MRKGFFGIFMKVALILVNYNGEKYLRGLFHSLSQLRFPKEACDIFFIDNASSDNSLTVVQNMEHHVARKLIIIKNDTNRGFTGGHNRAFSYLLSKQEYTHCALLNIDTTVHEDWLAELIAAVESTEEIGIAQSLILFENDPRFVNTAGNVMHYLGFGWCGSYKRPAVEIPREAVVDIGYASGAGMIIKRSVLEKIGCFEEAFFMYHEDLDLSWRARLAGFRIVRAPRSLVYHMYEFGRNKRKWFFSERNRLLTFFSLYRKKTIVVFLFPFVVVEVGMALVSLTNGWFIEKVRSYADVIHARGLIAQRRKWAEHFRISPDRAIMSYMHPRLEFSEVSSSFGLLCVNIFLTGYWYIARFLIRW